MSTVVVVLHSEQPDVEIIRRIREITGQPIGEIRAALLSGKPLMQTKLTFNDHDERASELRRLVALVDDTGVAADMYFLEEDEPYVEGKGDAARCEPSDILKYLDEWDRGTARLEDLDDKRSR